MSIPPDRPPGATVSNDDIHQARSRVISTARDLVRVYKTGGSSYVESLALVGYIEALDRLEKP